MNIHIVSPYQSAAMQRMTQPLVDGLPATISEKVDMAADINYHVPYHTLVGLEGCPGKHVMLYTHCNPPDKALLLDACERADAIVCMTHRGASELYERDVNSNKISVIYPGVAFPFRRRNIGVIGYEQPNGRKRAHILLDIPWRLNPDLYHFVLVGDGWEELAAMLQNAGTSAQHIKHIQDPELLSIYNQLDLLLVTGYAEGGPLPVLEAMACGVPILSPRFGFAADFLGPESIYDSSEEMLLKLRQRFSETERALNITIPLTWENYTQQHAELFKKLMAA